MNPKIESLRPMSQPAWRIGLLFWVAGLLLSLYTVTAIPAIAQQVQCTVIGAKGLRLREGPGMNYTILQVVTPKSTVTPVAANRVRQWLKVRTSGGKIGWMFHLTESLRCTAGIDKLPIENPTTNQPPANAATATAVQVGYTDPPTPTATPVQVAYTDVPNGGSGNDDNIVGNVRLYQVSQVVQDEDSGDDIYVLRDRLTMRLEVSYKNRPAGQGIRLVRFLIADDNDPANPVHRREEEHYPFCLFSNETNECEQIWVFANNGYRWPQTNRPIDPDTTYTAAIRAEASQGGQVNWQFRFRIQPPGLGPVAPQQRLQLQLAQTAPNSDADVVYDALVFQVVAFDPNVGANDGDGIRNVDLWIIGPNGEVYQRTESTPAYCAFQGGEPDCNIYNFNEQGYVWPNGEAIISGQSYTLRARANAKSGEQITQEWYVTVQ